MGFKVLGRAKRPKVDFFAKKNLKSLLCIGYFH